MYELVIRAAKVAVGDDWVECDIGIENGLIAEIGGGIRGREEIVAEAKWVLPGGIDAHCHLAQPPYGGVEMADDFRSGSMSAARGGTTCIVPFAMPAAGMDSVAAVKRSLSLAEGASIVDYGLHAVATPENRKASPDEFAALADAGVVSIKGFMTYEGFRLDDDDLLATFDDARAHGMTVMVHAENDAAIRRTQARLYALGRRATRYHAAARPEAAEREATHRALALAEISGARVVIVHISCRAALEELERARARGAQAYGETCPQYLFLTARDLDRPGLEAAKFVFSPPPRNSDSQAALWRGLEAGELSLFSSDHSPFRLADKLSGSDEPDFPSIISGVPGLATRLPLLFSEGLLTGRLTLARYLDLTSRNAAGVFGLADRKGRIEVGLEADLAIWDPDLRSTIRHRDLMSNVDFSPFEGRSVTGQPMTVIVRGVPVLRDGRLSAKPGYGRYAARSPDDPANFPIPAEGAEPWRDI
jgi:dihydropyrimidinase